MKKSAIKPNNCPLIVCFLGWFLFLACQSSNTLSGSDGKRHRRPSATQAPPATSPPMSSKGDKTCDLSTGSAVVLMYHRFDEPYESTSISVDTFTQQMEFFKTEGYQVVSLRDLVSALKDNALPKEDKWLALTIDDAYKSFLKVKPILEQYQYPYTIFVNTEAVEQGYDSSMTWADLKDIAQSEWGDLAAHSHTHGHLVSMGSDQRKQDILLSVELIQKNTPAEPEFFSYPFGEVSQALIEDIQSIDQVGGQPFQFLAGFSTQSGPVGCSSDLFSLPRFAMNDNYGQVNALLKVKLNSLHLPIYDYHPKNQAVCVEEKIDKMYFSTSPDIDLKNIRCYPNRGNQATQDISKGLVTVSLQKTLGFGLENPVDVRERVNCTAYYKGRYFWYGREFTILENSKECSAP